MTASAIPNEILAAHAELLAAEEHWLQAILARDLVASDAILHPDYRLIIGIEGQPLRVMPRQQWLELLPNYRITEHAITDRRVTVYGDTAVVVMLWSQTATAPGDRDISGNFLLTDIWQNTPDGWRVIERHSSRQEKAA
jgi:ketosteroid isomerase-like protein